jgi:hypothetical protein
MESGWLGTLHDDLEVLISIVQEPRSFFKEHADCNLISMSA